MNKKSQKKKKAVSSLIKFLKNRKNLTVALGICLAVFASAYVATAKFSADNPSGKLVDTGKRARITYKVVNSKGEGVADQIIRGGIFYGGLKNGFYITAVTPTNRDGYLEVWDRDICKDSAGKFYLCINDKFSYLKLTKITGSLGERGKAVSWSVPSPLAKNEADLYKKYEKRTNNGNVINLPMIVLKSDGKGGSVKYWKAPAPASSVKAKVKTAASTVKSKVTTTTKKATNAVKTAVTKKTTPVEQPFVRNVKGNKTINIPVKKAPSDGKVKVEVERKQCFEAGSPGHKNGGCVSLNYATKNAVTRSYDATVKNGSVSVTVGTVNIPMKVGGKAQDRIFWFDNGDSSLIIKSIKIRDPKTKKELGSQKGPYF